MTNIPNKREKRDLVYKKGDLIGELASFMGKIKHSNDLVKPLFI